MIRRRSLIPMLALLAWSAVPPTDAVERGLYRETRDRYEGLTLKLRIDLRPATHAAEANVVSAEGIGYGRERSPILFSRLENVYLERVTNRGAKRLGLTIYRSREEAESLRALAVPPPSIANPNASRTLASFAQHGSTSVLINLTSGKKEPDRQREELERLLDRIFYLNSEPTHQELVEAVRRNVGAPMRRLQALTGLDVEEIRAIIEEATP